MARRTREVSRRGLCMRERWLCSKHRRRTFAPWTDGNNRRAVAKSCSPSLRRQYRLTPSHASSVGCSFTCLEYSYHRAERHDVAGMIERRRVQARSAASVKKQGIGAIQRVTLKQRPQVDPATQSGPMLVIDGRLHSRFDRSSTSLKARTGVGVREMFASPRRQPHGRICRRPRLASCENCPCRI